MDDETPEQRRERAKALLELHDPPPSDRRVKWTRRALMVGFFVCSAVSAYGWYEDEIAEPYSRRSHLARRRKWTYGLVAIFTLYRLVISAPKR